MVSGPPPGTSIANDPRSSRRAAGAPGRRDSPLEIREPGSITAPDILRRTSIVSTSGEEFVAAAETAMQDASSRLDPEHGKMISAVWLDPVSSNGDRAEAGRLLLVLHHLASTVCPGACSSRAWSLLMLRRSTEKHPYFRRRKSIRRWATALAETAAQRRDEIDLWSRMRTDEPLLGARGLDPAVDVGAPSTESASTFRPP